MSLNLLLNAYDDDSDEEEEEKGKKQNIFLSKMNFFLTK